MISNVIRLGCFSHFEIEILIVLNMTQSPESITVQCSDPDRIIGSVDKLMPLLPIEVRRQFNLLKLSVLSAEGLSGVYDRFVGRNVADILADKTMPSIGTVVESGELNGVKYTLYEPTDISQDGG